MNAKIKVYTGTALTLALLLTVLKSLCCLFCFDSALGYFNHTFLVSLTSAITWVGAIWCGGALFLFPKDTIATKESRSAVATGALIVAAMLIAAAGIGLLVTAAIRGNDKPSLVCGALLFVGSIFLWLRLTKLSASVLACSGILTVAGFLSVLIVSHFDMFTAINSPIKMALHLSAIAAIAMILADVRLLLGDKLSRVSFVTRMLTLLFCLPTSVGHLVLFVFDKMPPLSEQTATPFFSLALLGAAIYAAAGLFSFADAQELVEAEGNTEEEKEFEEI